MDVQEEARLRKIVRQFEAGEGRTIEELLKTDEPLQGAEAFRLRAWFSNHQMTPRDDLDEFGRLVFSGQFELVQAEIISRVFRHSQEGSDDSQATAMREIYDCRWGPTKVPIFNLILLSTILLPQKRPKHLEIARFLISQKVSVDGKDLSGAQAIYHAISTKPTFDPEYAQILYDAGGNVNARNRYGDTAAHEIAMVRDPEQMQRSADALSWYFTHGGNVDIANNDGLSVRWLMASTHRVMQQAGMQRLNLQLKIRDVVKEEDDRRKALGTKACTFCGKSAECGKTLSICSRCKAAAYCSPPRKCQKEDWRHHKQHCKPTSRRQTHTSASLSST